MRYSLGCEDIPDSPTVFLGFSRTLSSLKTLFGLPMNIQHLKNEFCVQTDTTIQNLGSRKPSEAEYSHSLSSKQFVYRIKARTQDYLRMEAYIREPEQRRIKCGSVDRFTPKQLCKFYSYDHLLRDTKKTVRIYRLYSHLTIKTSATKIFGSLCSR